MRLFPSRRVAQAASGLGALSLDVAHLFPPWPQRAPPVGCLRLASVQKSWPLAATLLVRILRNSLNRNQGPVCSVGGGGFSGAEFAPFPSTLPPTASGDGPALLWSFSVRLFWEPPAVNSGGLIFSLAIGPVLTLSNAARSSPFRPYLLVAGAGIWGTFLLGVAFRHIICGPYLIFPPS